MFLCGEESITSSIALLWMHMLPSALGGAESVMWTNAVIMDPNDWTCEAEMMIFVHG